MSEGPPPLPVQQAPPPPITPLEGPGDMGIKKDALPKTLHPPTPPPPPPDDPTAVALSGAEQLLPDGKSKSKYQPKKCEHGR